MRDSQHSPSASSAHSVSQPWRRTDFAKKLNNFLKTTEEHTLKEANPGGHYTAIWPRDASYILKDQFISGANIQAILQQILIIWSHQITEDTKEKIVYGRGSPEMGFRSVLATNKDVRRFEGALPTTIYRKEGSSEVYAQNPDIDSTALMISTTSWILFTLLSTGLSLVSYELAPPMTLSKVIDLIVPRMLTAINYLKNRDIDNDGLLEQDHNEDWMDTILRKGKIVYSQACWIISLKNLSSLLLELKSNNIDYNKKKRSEAKKIFKSAEKTIHAVEEKLWSKEDGSYIDIQQEEKHIGGPYRTLTQDVCLYLVAIMEQQEIDDGGSSNTIFSKEKKGIKISDNRQSSFHNRAISTLNSIKRRIWKDKWPLVTEVELKKTGPWFLKPYQYHNHTFWPWTTGIEMLARGKFGQYKECNILFSKIVSEDDHHPHVHTFYEWVNPITDKPEGAYPFRTGISAVRIAVFDILKRMEEEKKKLEIKK